MKKVLNILLKIISLIIFVIPFTILIDQDKNTSFVGFYIAYTLVPLIIVWIISFIKPKGLIFKIILFGISAICTVIAVVFLDSSIKELSYVYYDPELNYIVSLDDFVENIYMLACYLVLGLASLLTFSKLFTKTKNEKVAKSENNVEEEKERILQEKVTVIKEDYNAKLLNDLEKFKEENPLVITIEEIIEEKEEIKVQTDCIEYLDVKEALNIKEIVKSSVSTAFNYLFKNIRNYVSYLFYLVCLLLSKLFIFVAPFTTISNFVITQRIMKGRELDISTSFNGVTVRRYFRYYLCNLFVALFSLAIILLPVFAMSGLLVFAFTIDTVFGSIMTVIASLVLIVVITILILNIFPVSYLYFKEDIVSASYFSRSIEASKGKKKKYILANLLLYLIMLGAFIIPALLIGLAISFELIWLLFIPIGLLLVILPVAVLSFNICYVKVMEG